MVSGAGSGSEASGPDMNSQSEAPVPLEASKLQNLPISHTRLEEIITEACDKTLQFVDSYQHPLVGKWNANIIQTTLPLLIKEATSHKFIVISTIVQHTTPPTPFKPKPNTDASTTVTEDSVTSGVEALGLGKKPEEERRIGRIGLHSATGAWWNKERDSTWSWLWKGSEQKGFDVIVTVFWVATV